MTTSPVMTITDELLAELESEASAVLAIRPEHCRGNEPIRGDISCRKCGAGPRDGCRLPLPESYAQPQVALALLHHIAELKERCAAAEKDTARLTFMLTGHKQVTVEQLPAWGDHDNLRVYVEEGLLCDKRYPAIAFDGDWSADVDAQQETRRRAIDAAIQSQGEMT